MSTAKAFQDTANRHTIDEVIAMFADDAEFERVGPARLVGKKEVRSIFEYDEGVNGRIELINCKVHGDTVTYQLVESNDRLRVAGFDRTHYPSCVLSFANGLIRAGRATPDPESIGSFIQSWALSKHGSRNTTRRIMHACSPRKAISSATAKTVPGRFSSPRSMVRAFDPPKSPRNVQQPRLNPKNKPAIHPLADAGLLGARYTIARNYARRAALAEYYEIKVKGHLDPYWSDWFAGLQLTHLEGNETLLSGSLPDQAALHGLLEHIRDLNIALISVTCCGPSAEHSDKE